jgi:glycosyltransferase involved in cell wall biosynthesis
MTVYNEEKYIGEAIDSILNQTFSDFEFILIDDSSTDKTLDIIKKFQDPRIILIQNENNIGFIKSLNIGIAFSKGEYVARQDADDISLPDRLLEEVKFLDNHPDFAMVGTARELIDEWGVKIMDVIPKKEPNFEDLCNKNPFQHSSIMIRKGILLEFGGYSELFPFCEDYALWLQIVKKYRVYNIPKILCKLRVHQQSISVKKAEEQAFSIILATRMAKNELSDGDIKEIQSCGVECFKEKLNKKEKIDYLNRIANKYRSNNDLHRSQRIYFKILLLDPTNLFAGINFFRCFLGNRIMKETTKWYESLRNHILY